jgi:ATP-dependent helicase HrpB
MPKTCFKTYDLRSTAMLCFQDALPIDEVQGELVAALRDHQSVVLVAPPGAGKTTRVPLILLEEAWANDKKLILLEPRRVAARAAAERLAAQLHEKPGERIGLLSSVACVIFDEFHERSLDADLGLALALDAQAGLREDLKLLVMSATLDGARVATLLNEVRSTTGLNEVRSTTGLNEVRSTTGLNHAPIVESQGRAFPVQTHYLGRKPDERLDNAVLRAILRGLAEEPGSILVFLPGQSEILRVAERLQERMDLFGIEICPLYSALDRAAQTRALAATKPPLRKIVLATSIAETSLTIEGVRIVIDCGLSRVPRYEPLLGLTRLETVRVSRASADQRRGRAGRTQSGVCYRLWEEAGNGALAAFSVPEILAADLSGLMLDLASWGVRDPKALKWLDPPPAPALKEAKALLSEIGALDADERLTELGKAIAGLALPPRLAAMMVKAAASDEAALAAEIAVLMVERGLGGDGPDLAQRLERFRADRSQRGVEGRRLAQTLVKNAGGKMNAPAAPPDQAGRLLALAFPDRIAKTRGPRGEFLLANGRAGQLEPQEPLAREPYLAVGELSGKAVNSRIILAAALSESDIETIFAEQIRKVDEIFFDSGRAMLKARRRRRLGALILSEQNLSVTPGPEAACALALGIASLGIERLAFSKALQQWRDRVMFLRQALPSEEREVWPDLSDAALTQTLELWLAPYLEQKTSLASIEPGDLESALHNLLPWDLTRKLEVEAPAHFQTPAGSWIALDYAAENGPCLAVRVQELYGLKSHPSIAKGRVPLTLELLSPAHRPIQITRDLPGFWRGSWAGVKTEMKGRYPRHPWPDDPAMAEPTARAKPRA